MRSGELTADTRQLRREERLPGLLCYTARLTGSDSPHQQISPTVGPDSFTSLPVPRPCNSKLMFLDSDRYLPMAFLRNFVFVLIISLLPSADQFVPMDWRADDTTQTRVYIVNFQYSSLNDTAGSVKAMIAFYP